MKGVVLGLLAQIETLRAFFSGWSQKHFQNSICFFVIFCYLLNRPLLYTTSIETDLAWIAGAPRSRWSVHLGYHSGRGTVAPGFQQRGHGPCYDGLTLQHRGLHKILHLCFFECQSRYWILLVSKRPLLLQTGLDKNSLQRNGNSWTQLLSPF